MSDFVAQLRARQPTLRHPTAQNPTSITMWTRRNLRRAAAATPAAASAMAGPKNIVISSDNGLRACARAMEMLTAGNDTLDAVIAGVNINEEDPEDTSVG